jgi:hypothetical protein
MKKLLALVLALVMTLGLATVSSNAAFKDADKIEHTEAVEVLTSLGVLNGMGDGSFQPEGNVTRAQMAKMIAIIMLGADVNDSAFVGTSSDLTDINGHWAEGFIKFCVAQGIVAGKGNGKFDPDANVTTVEASKMLLVALGFSSDVQEYTGDQWAIKVTKDAATKKLLEDLSDMKAGKAITRDEAAQMIWNTVQRGMIIKSAGQERTNDGKITDSYRDTDLIGPKVTLLEQTFEGKIFVGRFAGNHDSGAAAEKGNILVYGRLDTDDNSTPGQTNRPSTFPGDLAIENVGEEYKVVFKEGKGGIDNRVDKNDTVYGMFKTDRTTVVSATLADIGDQKSDRARIVVSGTNYDTKNAVDVYYNYVGTGAPVGAGAVSLAANDGNSTTNSSLTRALKVQSVDDVKFVIDPDDGKIELAFVTNYRPAYVTAVSSSKVTLSDIGSVDFEDNDVYSGVAKDDVVYYTRFYSNTSKDDATFTIAKAETLEGKLSGYRFDSGAYKNVVLDGTTYKVDKPAAAIPQMTSSDALTAPGDTNINDSVRVFLMKGMAIGLQQLETDVFYALVTDHTANGTGTVDPAAITTYKVSVMLADGTKGIYNVHKDSVNGAGAAFTNATLADGQIYLVKYSSLKDGVIKITGVSGVIAAPNSGHNQAQTTASLKIWNKDTKTFATAANVATSVTASKDAVVFVQHQTGEFSVYKMRDLSTVATGTGKASDFIKDADGMVAAGYINQNGAGKPSTASSTTLYGIVTGHAGKRTYNDDPYDVWKVAVGRDEDVEIWVNDTDSASGYQARGTGAVTLATGVVLSFKESATGRYEETDLTAALTTNDTANARFTIAAIKNYDEASRLLTYFTATSRANATTPYAGDALTVASGTVASDATITYVNAKTCEAGEEIGISGFSPDNGYANAVFHVDDDGVIDAIVIDSSREANMAVLNDNKDTAVGANFATNATYTYTSNAVAVAATLDTSTSTFTTASSEADGQVAFGTSITITVTDGTPAVGDAGKTLTLKNGTDTLGSLTLTAAGGVPATNTITFTMPAKNCTLTWTLA